MFKACGETLARASILFCLHPSPPPPYPSCPYQILRIRVTHEELLSLLRAEEITQLRVGAAFKPFSSINVRQPTFAFCKAHTWGIADACPCPHSALVLARVHSTPCGHELLL